MRRRTFLVPIPDCSYKGYQGKPETPGNYKRNLKGHLDGSPREDSDSHGTRRISRPVGEEPGASDDGQVEQDGREAGRGKNPHPVENALEKCRDRNEREIGKHDARQQKGFRRTGTEGGEQ